MTRPAQAEALDSYLSRLERYKSELFGLYEGTRLERKLVSRGGGWTWVYLLHSYGPTGISFDSDRHPRLDAYLRHSKLIWHDWQGFLPVVRQAPRCRALFERDARLPARLVRRLRQTIAGILHAAKSGAS